MNALLFDGLGEVTLYGVEGARGPSTRITTLDTYPSVAEALAALPALGPGHYVGGVEAGNVMEALLEVPPARPPPHAPPPPRPGRDDPGWGRRLIMLDDMDDG